MECRQLVVVFEVELGFVELRVDSHHALLAVGSVFLHAHLQLRQLQQTNTT